MVDQQLFKIFVAALPQSIPSVIHVDISELEIGKVITVDALVHACRLPGGHGRRGHGRAGAGDTLHHHVAGRGQGSCFGRRAAKPAAKGGKGKK